MYLNSDTDYIFPIHEFPKIYSKFIIPKNSCFSKILVYWVRIMWIFSNHFTNKNLVFKNHYHFTTRPKCFVNVGKRQCVIDNLLLTDKINMYIDMDDWCLSSCDGNYMRSPNSPNKYLRIVCNWMIRIYIPNSFFLHIFSILYISTRSGMFTKEIQIINEEEKSLQTCIFIFDLKLLFIQVNQF